MTKGTQSFGRRTCKTHTVCRRCGGHSFHIQTAVCSSCSYPSASGRKYAGWGEKAARRKAPGTGRQRHVKHLARRFKNGFREGTKAKFQRLAKKSA